IIQRKHSSIRSQKKSCVPAASPFSPQRALGMNGDKIPTADAVAVLPRLAQIAYAARCCRRVQPIYSIRLRSSDTESLNLAIEAVEQTAATGQPAPEEAGRVPFEVGSCDLGSRVGYAADAVSAAAAFAIEVNSVDALTTSCAYAAGKYA